MLSNYYGVLANAALVIIGSLIGVLFKNEKLKKIGERIFEAFAFFVIAMGVSGSIDLSQPLLILISLMIGVAIGELLDIDAWFIRVGNFLQNKFSKGNDNRFARGFIEASLLFCIGSMTLMGALEAGLENTHTIYLTKGVIDGVSAITFAMGNGIGVAFSALVVIIYQGLLVSFAAIIAPILSTEMIAVSSTIGSLFLIAIGFNMLGITKIKVANFIPAMFIPFIWQAILLLVK